MRKSNNAQALGRRQVMVVLGAMGLLGAGVRLAAANGKLLDEAMSALLGESAAQEGRIKIEEPEIAEKGNTVPIKLDIESPMTADDYVKSVHVFADGNPLPDVASFHFTPRSGRAFAATRMRLAKTQNVIAVAQMSDGSFFTAKRAVKVTIGGCGG